MKLLTTTIFSLVFLGMNFAQQPLDVREQQFKKEILKTKISQSVDDFILTNAYQSTASGLTHIYFSQAIKGFEVVGTESSIHIDNLGAVNFKNDRFLKQVNLETLPSEVPSISAIDGVQLAVANLGFINRGAFQVYVENEEGYYLINTALNFSPIKTSLKYFRQENNTLKLCWVYLVQHEVTDQSATIFVDAHSGQVEKTASWTHDCVIESADLHIEIVGPEQKRLEADSNPIEYLNCNNCYEVFPMPMESPYDGFRQVALSPENPTASPMGWHGDYSSTGYGDTSTNGNNVWAFDANDNYGHQPDGGDDLDFTGYDWGINYSMTNQYEDASITNLFYWVNIAHDVLYTYGFDERAGNFQFSNFSQGGQGGDGITAKSQTSATRCNASFGVGPDGTRTVLQSNVCRSKDANFDSTVILHEFGHGIYGRLTGGPSSTYCVYNEERTTEGIADWYAIMLTMKAEDTEDLSRHIAKFFFNRGATGNGIRPFPYSTDFNVNPQTYNSIKTSSIPHGVGAVWANVLWEMTWALINEHGFDSNVYNFTGDFNQDAGNVMALALVTEGLKLQACTPGFVNARDAIFTADAALYDGRNSCALWTAFAKRGLGVNALEGNPDSITDGEESFDTPSPYAVFDENFNYCYDDVIYNSVGGGRPYGGFYSGPGVTDNNDGFSFTLDIAAAGPGKHSIVYTLEEGECTVASAAESTLIIIEDTEAPEVICLDDVTETVTESESLYTMVDYTTTVIIYEDCDNDPVVVQNPPAGSLLGLGAHEISFDVSDKFDNVGRCSFILNVIEVVDKGEESGVITFYPNPFNDVIILENPNLVSINSIRVFDVQGRLIEAYTYSEKQREIHFNLEALNSGLYFVYLETPGNAFTKQVVKR